MKVIRTSAVLVVLGMLATASVGQESKPPGAPAPAPAPAAPSADKTPAPAPPAASTTAPPAKPPAGAGSGDEFIPTQELQADEEVTFPVDI
jgi:hypothetical protein